MLSVIHFFKHSLLSNHKAANMLVALVIALGLVGFAFQPASAAVAPGITCTEYYTVKKGDTLAKIGAMFGVSWRDLAFVNMIPNPNVIYTGQKLCVEWKQGSTPPAPATIPTFSIVSVVADKNVTISTKNFPANDTFDVLMGQMGTKGVGGIKVTSINSGSGGSFTATFNIPSALAGSYKIAIRLQSPYSGYYAYNWFYNNTTGTGTGGGDGTPGYSGYPTFSIAAVTRETNVTISAKNFPANDTFDVLMGPMGTKGVGGIKVTSINSGSGGSFTATFNIPSALAGSSKIAIRLQSPYSGYFAYNWFYNNTTP